jgi:hypothetical protein
MDPLRLLQSERECLGLLCSVRFNDRTLEGGWVDGDGFG